MSTVFSDIALSMLALSLTTKAFLFSYIIPLSLLFYQKTRRDISVSNKILKEWLIWKPFRVRSILRTLNNVVALAFSGVIIAFGFWSATVHLEPKMNFTIVLPSGTIILAVGYYLGWARTYY